jgi:hypothetical protein
LVFPFLVFTGKETKKSFQDSIPPTVFSDMVRLEHDGLQFDWENGRHSGRGYLPACEAKSMKWCGGVLYEMCGKSSLTEWRAKDTMTQRRGCDDVKKEVEVTLDLEGGGGEVWKAIDMEEGVEGSAVELIFNQVEPKCEMLVEDAMGVFLHYSFAWGWRICELSEAEELLKTEEFKRVSKEEGRSGGEQSKEEEVETNIVWRKFTPRKRKRTMTMTEFEEKKEVAGREARNGRVGAGVGVVNVGSDVGSDVGSALRPGVPYSKASAGAKSGPCLTYTHHCVFVMCGDLASMWSLFGFCGGPSGKEQCPLCTIARVDQWRGVAGNATPRNRDRDVPIPLSPVARYVMCVLHCTMRVGEFALERLIMSCINQKEGKNVSIGKASKKKKQSFICLDPSIVALNKNEVIQRLRNELSAQGKDEESINIWKKKKNFRDWMKPDLVQALDKLLIDKFIGSSKIAKAKCAELYGMDFQALKTMRAEKIPGKIPKARYSTSFVAHELDWVGNQAQNPFLIYYLTSAPAKIFH